MVIAVNARYLYDLAVRGINRYTLCLLSALQRDPQIELVLLSESRFPVHPAHSAKLRAEVVNLSAPKTLIWEQWVLPRYLRKRKPYVFHAPAEGGLPVRRVCPYVLTFHGIPEESLEDQVRRGTLAGGLEDYVDQPSPEEGRRIGITRRIRSLTLRKLYLRAADLVITPSEFSKQELVGLLGLAPEKVRVIHEAAADVFSERSLQGEAVSRVRAKYALPEQFLLSVGGFDAHKNTKGMLTVAAQLESEGWQTPLVVVGIGGGVNRCRAEAAKLGLREGQDVFFLQGVPDIELATLYSSATLFVTLSWHEGFCLPLVEAMACGAPIVASKAGAMPEVLGSGGELVDPSRLDEVVGTIRQVLANGQLRQGLRHRALARGRHFSWDRAARETVAVYEEAAKANDH